MSRSIVILNVEDDDDDADIVAHALTRVTGREYELHRTADLAGLPLAIASKKPDVILLDLHLPDGKGAETIHAALRCADDIPILVLTGSANDQMGLASIEAGAQDFIPKNELLTPHLARSIDFAIHRKQLQRDAESRATTDALTGLTNRGGLMRLLVSATARVRRHGRGFALAFLDLDGFKGINDQYGHAAGDAVLVQVAARALSIARANDCLCRLGGDEFVFYLDGLQTRAKARLAAARFEAVIAQPMTLPAASGPTRVAVTASFGLAVCPLDSLDATELMSIADRSMYERKRAKQMSKPVTRQNGAAPSHPDG